MENCLKHNDSDGAQMYAERIARKEKKLGIKPEVKPNVK